MLTSNLSVQLSLADRLAREAVADAELAEDLVLPDVDEVVLAQLVQLGADVQLLVDDMAAAQRAHRVRDHILLQVDADCAHNP